MWQVIYVAPSKEQAEDIEKMLKTEGILVKVEPINNSEYQLKVLESEATDAYSLLNNY